MPTTLDPINREVLTAELIRDEGLKLKTYRCTAGKLTVGVGRNLDAVGLYPKEYGEGLTLAGIKANGITKAQALFMLNSDIDRCIADLDRKLPWWTTLDEVRQRVLINMTFNLGIAGLLGFKNTLAMIQRRNYAGASAGMLNSLWARQVGARAVRLSVLMALGLRK